jgi:uncharacterized protein YndB with AHSA1/START domain
LSQTGSSPTVRESVLVGTTPEKAFRCFVNDMAAWWYPDHHVLEGTIVDVVVEPHAGGAIYDRNDEGSISQWGTVLAYEPPDRLVFSWHVSPRWTIDPDPAKASEVEVLFTPEGPGRTRVTLEHRHFERHGDGWEIVRDAVSAPESWPAALRRFADLAMAGA